MRVEEAEDEDISAGETMLGIKRTCLFKISILILSNSKTSNDWLRPVLS